MNSIIERIIEMEQNAKNVVETANDVMKQMDIDTNQQIAEIEESIDRRARNKIQQIRELEEQEIERIVRLQDESFINNKTKLIETFQKKEKEWEDEIFNKIISI